MPKPQPPLPQGPPRSNRPARVRKVPARQGLSPHSAGGRCQAWRWSCSEAPGSAPPRLLLKRAGLSYDPLPSKGRLNQPDGQFAAWVQVFEPKSGSWRPAAVWQIADIMRYGQETRGFAAATGG